MKTTQLYEYHRQNGKTTEFAGYEMPLWYTSTLDEHLAVRNACGIFDVSHMGRALISGKDAGRLLESLVPTSIVSQPANKSIYSLLLDEAGGILDDFIIMKMTDLDYMIVVNAVNTRQDLNHIRGLSQGFDASVADITESSAMIAVQGPGAQDALQRITTADLSELRRFRCIEGQILGSRSLISRTGYTGEDGFELVIYDATNEDPVRAMAVWDDLARTAKPCGLGARDSLRIEAGYPLYGSDIDRSTNPIEADLAWVVSPDKKDYLGWEAVLRAKEAGPRRIRRGIVLEEKIPRHDFSVTDPSGEEIGRVTSGTFSPILRKGIALSLVTKASSDPGSPVRVRVRDSVAEGHLVKPPFYDEKVYGWKRQSNGK